MRELRMGYHISYLEKTGASRIESLAPNNQALATKDVYHGFLLGSSRNDKWSIDELARVAQIPLSSEALRNG